MRRKRRMHRASVSLRSRKRFSHPFVRPPSLRQVACVSKRIDVDPAETFLFRNYRCHTHCRCRCLGRPLPFIGHLLLLPTSFGDLHPTLHCLPSASHRPFFDLHFPLTRASD